MESELLLILLIGEFVVLFMFFAVIPALIFLICVKKVNGKWQIRNDDDGIATYLYGERAIHKIWYTPKNMCELYGCAMLCQLATIVLFSAVAMVGFLLISAIMHTLSLPIMEIISTLFFILAILCFSYFIADFVTEPKNGKKRCKK